MRSKLKILYIHQDGLITGSFLSLKYLILGLNQDKYYAEVLFLNDGPALKEMESIGIRTYLLQTPTFWTYPGPKFLSRGNLQNYKALFPNTKLRKLIASINPSLVHINDKAALNAGISMLGLNIPIVQHVRSTFYIIDATINEWIQKKIIRLYADKIIGITEAEYNEFKSNKTNCIYNSIDTTEAEVACLNVSKTREELKISDKTINIAWVAKYNRQKGLWDFLEIAKSLLKKYPNNTFRFYMVGSLPNEQQLELDSNGNKTNVLEKLNHYLSDEEMRNGIILLGYRSDYLKIMAAMDIVVNCNRLGSMGRQTFETMAVGTVSISTHRYPELTQMIINGQDGFTVKEGDINSICTIIEKLKSEKNEIKQISINAKQKAKAEFDNIKQTLKITNLYDTLLNNEK
ncbi:MAG: glycosyltransferase family 4 protein [Bacteroidia bacterium]|nr:glycosyltransferase family 4 protein [Bacteroidia bacterium]MCC7532429.1 glycosyltransferase family 4 protein [Bacteroidia bacterium]